MRNVIEYTLVSADGVFDESVVLGFMEYQDDAYMRDGLGLLTACDAMLFGRSTYQIFAKLYQGGRVHPWADRMNAIPKYVFSSTLDSADWDNSTIVRATPSPRYLGSSGRKEETC
jgi:dihydrofolate reductase